MKFNAATVLTFAAAVSAVAHQKREVDPSAAIASFTAALPPSILSILATNTPAASSAIVSELTNPTGPPAWFTGLPSEVQSFIVASGGALGSATGSGNVAPTGGANSTAGSNSTVTATGNSTISVTKTGTSTTTRATTGTTAGASSSSSSGIAAVPTAVFSAGLAGALGVLGMLAL